MQLDREKMVAHFSDKIDIPLHPFFGSMGVAPPAAMGKISSAPPGIHAGNLDNKELVAGTTLFIPATTTPPGHSSNAAMATSHRATAKSTLPPSRHRSPAPSSSSSEKT